MPNTYHATFIPKGSNHTLFHISAHSNGRAGGEEHALVGESPVDAVAYYLNRTDLDGPCEVIKALNSAGGGLFLVSSVPSTLSYAQLWAADITLVNVEPESGFRVERQNA